MACRERSRGFTMGCLTVFVVTCSLWTFRVAGTGGGGRAARDGERGQETPRRRTKARVHARQAVALGPHMPVGSVDTANKPTCKQWPEKSLI